MARTGDGTVVGTSAALTTSPTTEETSLAAGLDQIEAAISEAHNRLDEVLGSRVAAESNEAEAGARVTMFRCETLLAELNVRLEALEKLTGRL